LLPEISHPAQCRQHRHSNGTSEFLEQIMGSSKFLDRYMVFSQQLHTWGYLGVLPDANAYLVYSSEHSCRVCGSDFEKRVHSSGRVSADADPKSRSPKLTLTSFARSNPDLLYMLPVRELHIFAKKFRAFPRRTLDRKYRAAAARLANVYVDFQMQPTFNGNACFQVPSRSLQKS
jgi:hypothetical protein